VADTDLLIFSKYPEPGKVMTRLCPPLSPEEAARIQQACIRLLCERAFRTWPVRPRLVVSPDDSEKRFREFTGPYVPVDVQGEGDLGARLARAVRTTFERGATRVMVVGADSPTLNETHIAQASAGLGEHDCVLGPCFDGGFYLIGLRRCHDALFDGIDWSSDRVFEQTKARAESCDLTVGVLDEWYDVDRFEDLERVVSDIKQGDRFDDFELRRVIEDVLGAVGVRGT
jgi:uncharacterized protein